MWEALAVARNSLRHAQMRWPLWLRARKASSEWELMSTRDSVSRLAWWYKYTGRKWVRNKATFKIIKVFFRQTWSKPSWSRIHNIQNCKTILFSCQCQFEQIMIFACWAVSVSIVHTKRSLVIEWRYIDSWLQHTIEKADSLKVRERHDLEIL